MEGFKKGAQTGGLESHGKAMGFKKGGYVASNTSGEFVMKTKKQATMDHGNMPAKKDGDSEQEKEAGGRAKVRPGYRKGGKAVKKADKSDSVRSRKILRLMTKSGLSRAEAIKYVDGVKKMHGGAVHAGASGAKHDYPGRNRVGPNPDRSQGEGKQPAQRGAKHVGKGGKTGMHKSGRITKDG